MLFFIDESWQATDCGKYKVGILSAVQIKSHDFNECSKEIYKLKAKHLGPQAAKREIKGNHMLSDFMFRLEADGIKSDNLNLIRDIMAYLKTIGATLFGSVVFEQEEIDLSCADENQLQRPFFFLFERIDLFMKENYPGMMAKIVFDDRGVQTNEKISASVSNFFHKCSVGQSFSSIIKVPFFAISNENIGIQIADIVAYILGCRFTGKHKKTEFFRLAKTLEFSGRTQVEFNGKKFIHQGFKVVKKKEAGDFGNPGRAT